MDQKLSDEELSKQLAEAAELVEVGAEYTHYKNKPYKVLDLAIIESNNEVCVIYQPQYGDRHKFVRPISNWLEEVEIDGKMVQRFTKV